MKPFKLGLSISTISFSLCGIRLCSCYNKVNYDAWHTFKPLFLLLLLDGSLVQKFHFQFTKKKTGDKSRKKSDIVQFGRWCDSFSSALCLVLWWSSLFQPMKERVLSEFYYNIKLTCAYYKHAILIIHICFIQTIGDWRRLDTEINCDLL